MAIQVKCACGRTSNFPDHQAGQKGRCMYCGKTVNIPQMGQSGPVVLDEGGAPVQDLSLQSPAPRTHPEPVTNQPAPPPPTFKPPVRRGPAPGLGIGNIVFYGITAVVIAGVALGIWSLVHWWNTSEYESFLRGGDDWLAKGYLTDAEMQYKKAEKLFPDDPRTTDAFERLAVAQEAKRRSGRAPNAILGPIAPSSVMSVDQQHRMMQAQNRQFQRQREMERRVREMEEGPPVTTQTLKSREQRAEEARKAREARRKAGEDYRAELDAKRQEAARIENEERRRRIAAADKKAEELKRKEEEERKAKAELLQQRLDRQNLDQLNNWSNAVLDRSIEDYKRKNFWSRTSSPDDVAASVMKMLADDANNEEVVVRPPTAYKRIPTVADVAGLSAFYREACKRALQAEDAEVAGRNAKVIARNQLSSMLRGFEKLAKQEAALEKVRTTDSANKRDALRADKDKLAQRMLTQCIAYMEGLNKCRGGKAAKEMVGHAKELTAKRLKELGADLPAAAAERTADQIKTKTYVLKDGTEIKAVTVGSMGEQLLIKDRAGKMHTVNKADVKLIGK